MKKTPEVSLFDAPDEIMREAGAWLAKKDRGFTAEEEQAFERWRFAQQTHMAAVAQLEQAMNVFDRVSELQPEFGAKPDPDAFALAATRSKRRVFRRVALSLGAAALVLVVFRGIAPKSPSVQHYVTAAGGYERVTMADGSVVDLNASTELDVDLRPVERRVQLVHGEAHFQVAKDQERPFIVTAQGVAVRAVGTAFDVRLDRDQVSVLVTEGKVHVKGPETSTTSADHAEIPLLEAGHSVVVSLVPTAPVPQIAAVTPSRIAEELAWQPRYLNLRMTPLAEIVAELNRHAAADQPRIVVDDAELGALKIGGNFRADEADAFIRLLESSFGVTAERDGHTITLRRAK